MMFRDLLTDASMNAEEQQRFAAAHFPDELSAHGMRLWRPGESYSLVAERYLLGVATYSVDDLKLMDMVDFDMRNGRFGEASLDFFDMSRIKRMAEFEEYIPGITPVNQSPILGVWRDGILVERLQGYAARRRLISLAAGRK